MQQQLKSLFDSIAQPVFYTQDGRLSYLNPEAVRCGLQPDTDLAALLLPGETLPSVSGQESASIRLQLPAGTADAAVHPRGDGYLFVLSFRDRKDSLQALSSTADALRGPLTNLFSISSSLFSYLDEAEDPSIRHNLAALSRSQYQILNLITNLDDYTKVCDGTLRIARKRVELTAFLCDLYDSVEPLCSAAGRKLRLKLPTKAAAAWVDPVYLKRMLLLLVSNAVKFSDEAAELTISYAADAAFVVFSVTDCGEGMTPEVLAGAFCRFEDRGLVPDPRWGVGFGLPLVRGLAELHGGSFALQTEPGHGTTAAIRLPIKPDSDAVLFESPKYAPTNDNGFVPELVALSDVLPMEVYDLRGLL